MTYFDDSLIDKEDFSLKKPINVTSSMLRFRDCIFDVSVNTSEIADSISSLYKLMITPDNNQAPLRTIKYCHFYESNKYHITRNGKLAYTFKHIVNSIPRFDWMMLTDVIDQYPNLTILHAAAVTRDNKVLIIVGKSGAGKSTLTMKMCMKGWDFITDEIVILDKGVRGMPRAFSLSEILAGKLFSNTSHFIKGVKRDRNYVYINPEKIDINIHVTEVKATHIIFPKKAENSQKSVLKDVPLSMVAYRLIDALFETQCSFEEKLDTLINCVENVSAADYFWSDTNPSIGEVENFLS